MTEDMHEERLHAAEALGSTMVSCAVLFAMSRSDWFLK